MTDWMDRPLREIAQALREGNLTAEELAELSIARHEKWDGQLSAYKSWNSDFAREQATAADKSFRAGNDLGPLQGVSISVKDLYGVSGLPTFAGTPNRLPQQWEQEGPVIKAVRRQLAVIPGKAHTVEFAYGGIGANAHWGTPRNPWDADQHRVPGGSSAGAGVSLWEGSASFAFGTDTGGSVRIPASFTGCVGIKTTKSRWSTDGIVPLSSSFDTPGIIAKSMDDAVYAFEAVDPKSRHSGVKIEAKDISDVVLGVTKGYFWDRCQDDIAEIVENTISKISAAGAKTVDTPLPEAEESLKTLAAGAIVAAEIYAFLEANLPKWIETLEPRVRARIEDGNKVSGTDYVRACNQAARLAAQADATLSTVDVLTVPTIPITPPTVEEVDDLDVYRSKNMPALSNTMPGNILGLSAVTLPVGLDKAGMPVGLQLISRSHQEENLLSTALAIDAALGPVSERIGSPPLGGSL